MHTLGGHRREVPAEEFELLLVYLERSLLEVGLQGDAVSLKHISRGGTQTRRGSQCRHAPCLKWSPAWCLVELLYEF